MAKNAAKLVLEPIRLSGRNRIVIDKTMPSIDGGLFAVKRIESESIPVETWVLADGHDQLAVRLQWRRRFEPTWKESPMKLRWNDEWLGEFLPDGIGYWEYNVSAWVDGFLSWRYGFIRKLNDGQDPQLELLIGANLVEEASTRAPVHDAALLLDWAGVLRDAHRDTKLRADLALSERVLELVHRYPDRSLATTLDQWVPVLVERERAIFGAWYEFFPRSWGANPGEHGTFKTSQRLLPEIARMGFSIVYLPPIHPIGVHFRKGKNNALRAEPDDVGSPWAIGSHEGGHKDVNPRLGTHKDFQDFIWAAGENNLEVAMDIAFQCAPDHPYVKQHPQWFKWRPDGTVQYAENPPKKYQDILPFNFETEDWEALWHELRSVFLFWIQHGVKIFRVDNPHTKPVEFWRWCITTIKEKHPEVLFLAEAFTRPKMKYRLAKSGFTQGYTYFTWRNSKEELTSYVRELTQSDVKETFFPNFWPNTPDILHDYLVHGGRAGHIIRVILAATLSSNWGMYGPVLELFERTPTPGKEEYYNNEKYQLRWWDWETEGNLKNLIARINQIRKDNRALQRTTNITFCETDNPFIIAYLKSTPDLSNQVLTVVNLDYANVQQGMVTLPLDKMGLPSSEPYLVQDMLPPYVGTLPTANYLWRGVRNFVKLDPVDGLPAHVFRVFREHRREADFDYWA
ncbi:MAG: alpha-1,4-glucan--maltose-1-phosphate maltosyltransferase [Verrucomicrobiota bacterium]|nr:alpha-1,4-glucan--maltose-1-phosphate maltosyltransferase [Verrucomicrobiota bacterium]